MQSPNTKHQNSEKDQTSGAQKAFDLEERLGKFGEDVIGFCKSLRQDAITKPLINQIIRSATAIGANYSEANNASSRKDFRNKVYIAKKEAEETKHWLRMLKAAVPEKAAELRLLWQEAHEIVLILQSIINKVGGRKSDV